MANKDKDKDKPQETGGVVADESTPTTAAQDAAIAAANSEPQSDGDDEGEVTEHKGGPTAGDGEVAFTTSTKPSDRHVKAAEPGDDGYNVYSDPVIPSSALAEVVAAELAGGDKSPTRDALVEASKQ
jgi:hypothetical protein